METVVLPRTLINHILEQAQGSPDAEICGLITAHANRPTHCYPIANAAARPQHHFRMDPRQQIDALREIRQHGEQLFAIYHSHPDAPPTLSVEDIARAAYPDILHIIVSLDTKGILQMRGFRLQGETPRSVDIIIGNGD
jgi:proteasome lid subunit RPN8/RPN11